MSSWERQFSFTVPLSTQMYKWEPVIIILGRRAITNLSSSRYETLGLVTTHHITCSKHLVVLRIIASYYGNQSKPAILQLECHKKLQFHSAPRKLKYCILPSYQSSRLWRKIHSSPVQSLVCSTRI